MDAPNFSPEKLAELVLYIARKSEGDVYFGATKLNKALFYADFLHYAKTGQPITGAVYVKREHGPVPKPINVVKQKLIASGAAAERAEPAGIYTQKRLMALRHANLSLFTAEEVAFVDEVLEQLDGVNATTVSNATHRLDGWRLASMFEEIPYYTVFLPDGESDLTEEEIAYGREVAQRLTVGGVG